VFRFQITRIVLTMVSILVIAGCSMWSATPKRTTQDYGQSVRTQVSQAVYDPARTENPKINAPDGLEGQKGALILQRAYQGDLGTPSRVRSPAQLGISSNNSVNSGN
jgi:uncharacterized lipoprotein